MRPISIVGHLIAACAIAACSNHLVDLTEDESGFVFLVQATVPSAVMDALFQGRVVADANGCLRLDSVDDATVVWPAGYRLVRDGTQLLVRSPEGRTAGRLGGSFKLGGGEVDALHDGLSISAADRQIAQSRCPGKFWIVGDVL